MSHLSWVVSFLLSPASNIHSLVHHLILPKILLPSLPWLSVFTLGLWLKLWIKISHACHLSPSCWPASWPVGPWLRSWSWSSSSCSSTLPNWRSACLEAIHKRRPSVSWVLNVKKVFEVAVVPMCMCVCGLPRLSPSAGCDGSSCRGSWRPVRTALCPPPSTRLGRGWSWRGQPESAPHHVCATTTCPGPDRTQREGRHIGVCDWRYAPIGLLTKLMWCQCSCCLAF